MARESITMEIDKDLKASGEALFRSLGMNFSTAVTAFVSYSVKMGGMPFEIDEPEPPGFEYNQEMEADDPYWTHRRQAEIQRRIAEVEAGEFVRFDPATDSWEEVEARLNGS